MRSEIERSMHLVLDRSETVPIEKAHTDLSNDDYTDLKQSCRNLTSGTFKPIFGTKMIELTKPVIYGITASSEGRGYTLQRCGAPLRADGRYQEDQPLFLSPVLDDIAALPCRKDLADRNQCPAPQPPESILENIDFIFTAGKTPLRTTSQPALRIETDENSKLIKFIDPTPADDAIKTTFLQIAKSGNKSSTTLPTYFAAFARADKRINGNGDDEGGGVLAGAFFKKITSKRLRFVLDGSGSMSACVMWGEGSGPRRTYYNPAKGYYIQSTKNCAFTRMESMQDELTTLLTDLSEDTKIGLRSFSTNGRTNNKSWAPSSNKLVTIGEPGMRESAIAFVNSLDNYNPGYWGGTKPWRAIEAAFDDEEVDTLYLLSDGQPNNDPWGGSWSNKDHIDTAKHYARQNANRDVQLKVNSTALGISAPWMEMLSEMTKGNYNQIDQESLAEEETSS